MESTFTEISYIVLVAAILAWLASVSRQPVILAYILGGVIIGPGGLGLVQQVSLIDSISHIGITLLLFLAGMVLHPQRLFQLFKEASLVTLAGCAISLGAMFLVALLFGFNHRECLFAGLALMFSSTVLVVKLLPTTTLHQRHMGAICIAVLIFQDLIAVTLLIIMNGSGDGAWLHLGLLLPLKAVLLVAATFLVEQFVLRKMMNQSSRYHEVMYMLCFGWCLGVAALAGKLGLSYEVGSFIAGVAIARSPISRFLHEQMKPIRDFFLMFFFFVLGARLNLFMEKDLWLAVIVAAVVMVIVKSVSHGLLFVWAGEKMTFSRETGVRLGQGSEFGLIIAMAAERTEFISRDMAQVIQLIIILTMILSSYLIIFSFPTPLGAKGTLKQD